MKYLKVACCTTVVPELGLALHLDRSLGSHVESEKLYIFSSHRSSPCRQPLQGCRPARYSPNFMGRGVMRLTKPIALHIRPFPHGALRIED